MHTTSADIVALSIAHQTMYIYKDKDEPSSFSSALSSVQSQLRQADCTM